MADEAILGRIVFDTKGIARAARGFGAGPTRAAAAAPRTSKNIAATSVGIGKLAASFAAGMAVWEGIKAGIGKLVAASPQLQASISLLKKSLEFTLRPIGDAIGGALRPFALAWLRFSLKWYKDVGPKMEKWFTSLIDNTGEFAKTFFGEEGLLGGDLGQVLADLFLNAIPQQFVETWEQLKSTLSTLWKFLSVDMLPVWQILGAVLGVVILAALKGFKFALELLQGALEFLGPLINEAVGWFADQLAPVFEAIPGIIDGAITALKEWGTNVFEFFTKTIPETWEKLKIAVATKMEAIKKTITDIWEGVKTVVSTVIDGIKTLVEIGWNLILTIMDGVIQNIINLLNLIPFVNIGGGGGGGGDTGGLVNKDFIMRGNKVTRFSPQDTLIGFKGDTPPTGGASPLLGRTSTSIVVNINALDAASIDDNVIRRITEAIDNAQRRGIMSRTMQGAGS